MLKTLQLARLQYFSAGGNHNVLIFRKRQELCICESRWENSSSFCFTYSISVLFA